MLKRLPSKAAYTLIEVLVVVVILGLLGGIVVRRDEPRGKLLHYRLSERSEV